MSSTETDAVTEATDAEEPEAPPVDTGREELLASLTGEFGDAVVESHIRPDSDLWVRLDRDAWKAAGLYLRDGLGFHYFNFLSGLDWLPSPFGRDMDSQVDLTLEPADAKDPEQMESGYAGGATRFQVFARVNDIVGHRGITLKADLPDDDLRIDSWVSVYSGSNWHERECWEMYGISFDGHPGMRHIYLPTEFEGNPLRKDYPLLARRVKPWPGIVDVELMPGEEDDGDTAGSDGDSEGGDQ